MRNYPRSNRPNPQLLAKCFLASTGCEQPPPSKVYYHDTPSPVNAVAEFADMGAVVVPSNKI